VDEPIGKRPFEVCAVCLLADLLEKPDQVSYFLLFVDRRMLREKARLDDDPRGLLLSAHDGDEEIVRLLR
jgi:hypothetical protein